VKYINLSDEMKLNNTTF